MFTEAPWSAGGRWLESGRCWPSRFVQCLPQSSIFEMPSGWRAMRTQCQGEACHGLCRSLQHCACLLAEHLDQATQRCSGICKLMRTTGATTSPSERAPSWRCSTRRTPPTTRLPLHSRYGSAPAIGVLCLQLVCISKASAGACSHHPICFCAQNAHHCRSC